MPILVLRRARPDGRKVSRLVVRRIHGRLEQKGKIGQLRTGKHVPESLKPDRPISDVLVPVLAGTQLPLGVVGMDQDDTVEADSASGLLDRGPEAAGC